MCDSMPDVAMAALMPGWCWACMTVASVVCSCSSTAVAVLFECAQCLMVCVLEAYMSAFV